LPAVDRSIARRNGPARRWAVELPRSFFSAEILPASVVPSHHTGCHGLLNLPYTQQLQQKGGVGALSWTVSTGTLPTGLTLSFHRLTVRHATTLASRNSPCKSPTAAHRADHLDELVVAVVPPLSILPTLPTAIRAWPTHSPSWHSRRPALYVYANAGALPTGSPWPATARQRYHNFNRHVHFQRQRDDSSTPR